MIVATLMLCLLSFAALAAATERAQETLFAKTLPAPLTRWLRVAGWAGLSFALWGVVAVKGWALGLVTFSGQTSFAAGVIYLALIVRERRRA